MTDPKWLACKSRRGFQHLAGLVRLVLDYIVISGRPSCRFELRLSDLPLHNRDATPTNGFGRRRVLHRAWALSVLARSGWTRIVDGVLFPYLVNSLTVYVSSAFVDYRPVHLGLDGLKTRSGAFIKLPFDNEGVESISCMHVPEHIGFGRYGDPVDCAGALKALSELNGVVTPGGLFLRVLRIGGACGRQFKALKIYRYDQIFGMVGEFRVDEFALIEDEGRADRPFYNVAAEMVGVRRSGSDCFSPGKRPRIGCSK